MKSVVTSAKKSAVAKKSALTAASKKPGQAGEKPIPKKASRTSATPATASKSALKPQPAAKVPAKSSASKTSATPAPNEKKISSKNKENSSAISKSKDLSVKQAAKKNEKTPEAQKQISVASVPVSTDKDKKPKVSTGLQSGKNMSASKTVTGLEGKIEKIVVSKVKEVATNTTKSNESASSEVPLLTEEQILKMTEEDYMNPAQLAFFKARLQQLEKDLLKNAGETTEHLRETVLVPDPADRATIEEEHALELRTRDRERKLLKKVQQSLASIESGDYGWCEETGEPIGIPRLLARPTATLSLEAQQRRELKQKLYGD
jgi:DnaK suppressor protein